MRVTLAFLIAVASLQCSIPSPGGGLAGEWWFADTRNAQHIPDAITPPAFDVITLSSDGQVRLQDSLRRREFQGQYEATGTDINWTFQPSDVDRPIEQRLHFFWSAERGLVLRSADARDSSEARVEWVYFRAGSFLPNAPVVGDWQLISDTGEVESSRSLFANGDIEDDPESHWGTFRLWNSGSVTMMTTLMWVQGHGAFAMFEEVEVQEDRLVLAGRSPPGISQEAPRHWVRVTNAVQP